MWCSDSEVHPFSAAFIKPMPGPDNIYFIYFLQVGQHQKLNYLKTPSPLWGFIFLHPHIWAQVPHFRVAIIVPSCAKVKILSIHLPFFHSKCPYVTKSGAKEPKSFTTEGTAIIMFRTWEKVSENTFCFYLIINITVGNAVQN